MEEMRVTATKDAYYPPLSVAWGLRLLLLGTVATKEAHSWKRYAGDSHPRDKGMVLG